VMERQFEFSPECQQKMDDLALASRVRADLAINSSTSDLEVEVVSQHGAVAIKGKVATLSEIGEVKRVVMATSGVTSVNLDELAPPVRV